MKKIFIIIIFLFLLSGCTDNEDEYYVGRVDILNNYNQDENKLKLDFYTTNECKEINCIIEDETIDYKYNIEKNKKIVEIDKKKLYQHSLDLEFKNEICLEEIIMEFDQKLLSFNFGRYESRRIVVGENNYIRVQPIYNLNDETKEVEIRVSNLTKKELNFHTIQDLNKSGIHVIKTLEAKDLMVGINQTVISEDLMINDKLACVKMSTYIKYEYSFETDRINNNYVVFKLGYDNETIDLSCFSQGITLEY